MAREPVPIQAQAQMRAAAERLSAGRPLEARALLEPVLRAAPRAVEPLQLLAACLLRLGDPTAAETALRQAVSLDKREPALHTLLGEALEGLGRQADAEKSYRAALALNRRFAPAVRQLTLLLTGNGRAMEALQVAAPLVAAGGLGDPGLAHAYGGALKGAGRFEEALAVYRGAAEAPGGGAVALHNLAGLLGDLGRHGEAEARAREAMAAGLQAPETRLVHARALLGLGRLEEAEAAFLAALGQRPLYLDAHRDLAQLIWMRTGDVGLALQTLRAATAQAPDAMGLQILMAKVMTNAGDAQGAARVLYQAAARAPNDPVVLAAASRAAVQIGEAERGLGFAEAACRATESRDLGALGALCEALLAVGLPDQVAETAQAMARIDPASQAAYAYLAVAWRLLDDARYAELYDFDAFVRPYLIAPPPGWSSLEGYLDDLSAGLNAAHLMKTHPFDQSLRHGSQIPRLTSLEDPAVKAFPRAVDGAVRRYMQEIGQGKDPLRRRNVGGYAIQGIWSVRLGAGGGRHVDHIHPEGWLSSACYIALPAAVDAEGVEGWIKFGEPGTPTTPALGPQKFVRPEPGMLVLFPSYMWHGTVPFTGEDRRLTVAFDIAPSKGG